MNLGIEQKKLLPPNEFEVLVQDNVRSKQQHEHSLGEEGEHWAKTAL
jgi:hypothetical protein